MLDLQLPRSCDEQRRGTGIPAAFSHELIKQGLAGAETALLRRQRIKEIGQLFASWIVVSHLYGARQYVPKRNLTEPRITIVDRKAWILNFA